MIFSCFLVVKLFTEINNQSTMKGCIVLIIGLPASGKTTFTTKLVNYIINSNHVDLKPLYLNFDKVIPLESQLFLVNQLDSSWKESRRHFVSSCQAFLHLLLNSPKCVSSSRPVPIDDDDTKYLGEIIDQLSMENVDHFDYFCFIVEDNFYYKSMREQFFRLSRQFKLGLLLITINTPLDSCLKRNEKRSNSVDEKVIKRMADYYERPVKDEFGVGVGETIQLMEINCYDGESKLEDGIYEKVVSAIRKACDTPIKSKFKDGGDGDNNDDDNQQETREVSRKVTADNLVHRFDKLLRLCVNRMMMDPPPPSMGVNCNIGKELSIIRKRLLKRFANNQLDPGLGEALIKEEETPTNQRLMNLIQSELEERKGKH